MKRRDFLAKARAVLLLPALPAIAGNAERVPGISGSDPMVARVVILSWRDWQSLPKEFKLPCRIDDRSWACYCALQVKDAKSQLPHTEKRP
jgi:hypothetical protein